jgi:glutathionyl-hydroquinone reductase
MKNYIMNKDEGGTIYSGTPSQIIDQITTNSKLGFKTREDLRRTYASFACDWTGKPIRFHADKDLVDDLIECGVLKEQK